MLYQLQGMFKETYIAYLRNKTMRGQLRQKERGFFVGEKTFGYKSEPSDMVLFEKYKKGPEGYKMRIFEEEATVVRRIFDMYAEGRSCMSIVKTLNQEEVLSIKKTKQGWTAATIHRILKNEKYIGRWSWGRRQNRSVTGTGRIHTVLREKPLFEATYEDLRIIPGELWDQVQMKPATVKHGKVTIGVSYQRTGGI